MNLGQRVNKINRGFVDRNGRNAVLFLPRRSGGLTMARRGIGQVPAHPFPQRGKGRGDRGRHGSGIK